MELKSLISMIQEEDMLVFNAEWNRELTCPRAKKGTGGNKLRTYCNFKSAFETNKSYI